MSTALESGVVMSCEFLPATETSRAAFAANRMDLIRRAQEASDLVMGGDIGDPPTGSLFLFRNRALAERFQASDPYESNGLVAAWKITTFHAGL